jgi:hypothetical protein
MRPALPFLKSTKPHALPFALAKTSERSLTAPAKRQTLNGERPPNAKRQTMNGERRRQRQRRFGSCDLDFILLTVRKQTQPRIPPVISVRRLYAPPGRSFNE